MAPESWSRGQWLLMLVQIPFLFTLVGMFCFSLGKMFLPHAVWFWCDVSHTDIKGHGHMTQGKKTHGN